MTTRKHWRSRYPLDSFDPRWALLLKKAVLAPAEQPITMVFRTNREAAQFKQRLYSFRGKAREEKHPDLRLFMRVCVSQHANILSLFAQDSQFEDAFVQAGVGEDPERPVLEPGENIMDDPELAGLFGNPLIQPPEGK